MAEDEGFSSLTGAWTGVYDYPTNADDPVAFTATLEETAGALLGEIAEPNTFADAAVDCLLSTISGAHADGQVSFVKCYEGLPGADHEVRYDGSVDAALTKIVGTWRIATDVVGGAWSGPFVMNRARPAAAEVVETAEEAVIDR